MTTQPTRLKFGAFLKQYLKQSLQVFKHPKQLLPTAILTVVWMVLGILQIKVKENLPMQVLNFITYAQGGLYGGVVSAIGGILGKVVVAAFVNALIVPLFQGKMPFKGAGNGVKDLFKSISLKSRSAVAPLLKGFGAALLLYGLSNISGRPENTMAGIMAAVSLVLAMGKKNGFLWNFAFSYANSVTKGKAPDYQNVLRALTGMTLGFALGVGLNAAGIGLVGIIGIVALVLGWILGMGTKKEAVVSALLVILTLVPAPEAEAAKKKVVGAWVLKEIQLQKSESQDGYKANAHTYGTETISYTQTLESAETKIDFHHFGLKGVIYYPGEGFSSEFSVSKKGVPVSMECFVQGSTNPDYAQPEAGKDGNYAFTFPSLEEIGSREWSFVYKFSCDNADVYATHEYRFEWEEVELGNWVLKEEKIINPGSTTWSNDKDNLRLNIDGISYNPKTGDYSFDEELSEKHAEGWTAPGEEPHWKWYTNHYHWDGTFPLMKGPYKPGTMYHFPNDHVIARRGGSMESYYRGYEYAFVIRIQGEQKIYDRKFVSLYVGVNGEKYGYNIMFPTHEEADGDVLKVECALCGPGVELNHTYIFTWGGGELTKDEKAALAGGEEEGDGGGDGEGVFSDLIDRLQDLLDNGEHTDEEETIIIDLIAGLLAAGGAAGAAGGGLPFGPDGGEPDGGEDGKSEEEKEWEKKQKEYDDWVNRMKDRYTRKNPDGTVTVIDPATGERSTLYPTEEGNYKNEDGNPVTDNDLANWLDDHERNSDYYDQNAQTAQDNLSDWRQRNKELKDFDRKEYEKKKAETKKAQQKEDYMLYLGKKYGRNSTDVKGIKKDILKDRMKANEDFRDATKAENAANDLILKTKLTQDCCDTLLNVGAKFVPGGKTVRDAYTTLKSSAGRWAEARAGGGSWKDAFKKAGAGAVEGGIEVLKNRVEDGFKNAKINDLAKEGLTLVGQTGLGASKEVVSGIIDGKKPQQIVEKVKDATAKEIINFGIGKIIEKGSGKLTAGKIDQLKNDSLYTGGGEAYRDRAIEALQNKSETISNLTSEVFGGKATDFAYEGITGKKDDDDD